MLGYAGWRSRPEGVCVIIGRVATVYYFLHFLIILPLLGKLERPLPLPASIAEPVLRGGGSTAWQQPGPRWRSLDARRYVHHSATVLVAFGIGLMLPPTAQAASEAPKPPA